MSRRRSSSAPAVQPWPHRRVREATGSQRGRRRRARTKALTPAPSALLVAKPIIPPSRPGLDQSCTRTRVSKKATATVAHETIYRNQGTPPIVAREAKRRTDALPHWPGHASGGDARRMGRCRCEFAAPVTVHPSLWPTHLDVAATAGRAARGRPTRRGVGARHAILGWWTNRSGAR